MADNHRPWVTASDVAREAGVSPSAVSRAFTPGASIAPDTRQRVMKAAKALGYQVNMIAREMIMQRSNLVGVVMAGFENPFRANLLAQLVTSLSRRNFSPLVMNAEDPVQIARSMEMLLSYRIAGAIMTSATPPISLATQYLKLEVPVTMINREPELPGADVVISDNAAGGALAAQMLIDAGARRLAFVGTARTSYNGKTRYNGFLDALKTLSGISRRQVATHFTAIDDYDSGARAARELLAQPEIPDGVFCSTDLLALGFMDVARHNFNVRIPEDLAVVGFDDIPAANFESYQLSTIQQDTQALANIAIETLVERMTSFHAHSRVHVVPVSCVVRRSCS